MATAEAAGLTAFVATTPPQYKDDPEPQARVLKLNDALLLAFQPEQLVDFYTGFSPDLFSSDGVHLNDAGHQLRAERVHAVITE